MDVEMHPLCYKKVKQAAQYEMKWILKIIKSGCLMHLLVVFVLNWKILF